MSHGITAGSDTFRRGMALLRAYPPNWHLLPERTIEPGDCGSDVRLIQEWLNLRGHPTMIDGRYGPHTQIEIVSFQRAHGLRVEDTVDEELFARLALPMVSALAPPGPHSGCPQSLVAPIARQHLRAQAREVGGQNRGPWVRLYMDGHDGPSFPWCAGFVSFVVRSAYATMQLPPPFELTFSCNLLARSAMGHDLLVDGRSAECGRLLTPGSIFLLRSGVNNWTHCGFVTAKRGDVIKTVEGNTNADGTREGYSVCGRQRRLESCDFIILEDS